MKPLLGGFLLFWATGAMAAPLAPVDGGTLDGIPTAQALATMQDLGEWGPAHLLMVMSHGGGECGVSGDDDSNICGRFTLFAAVSGETSVPVDFTLFRLPETLGWKVPEGAKMQSGAGKYAIPLSACEMKKTAKGSGWIGTSYVLRIAETIANGHFVHTADLEKLPGERPDCAN